MNRYSAGKNDDMTSYFAQNIRNKVNQAPPISRNNMNNLNSNKNSTINQTYQINNKNNELRVSPVNVTDTNSNSSNTDTNNNTNSKNNSSRKSVRFSSQLEQFHKNTTRVLQQGILKKAGGNNSSGSSKNKSDENNDNNTNTKHNNSSSSSSSGNGGNKKNVRPSFSDQLSAIGNTAQEITNEIRANAGMANGSNGSGSGSLKKNNSKFLFTLPAKCYSVGKCSVV